MSLFKVILDGTILQDEPEGLERIRFQLTRDEIIKGLVLKTTTTLKFHGDGYDFLLDRRKNNLCESVSVEIYHRCSDSGNFDLLFEGTIFVSNGETVQFDPIRCYVDAEIEDANFGAKIENNKKIKAFIGVGISKNQEDIDPATSTEITFFNTATGADTAARTCYSVYECFRFLVDFMSDGTLNFTSDYFLTGDGKDWFVCTGEEIRTTSDSESPYFSFEDLFNEMFAQTNVSFAIEGGDTIRIEPEPDLFETASIIDIEGINDAVEYIDNTKLYDKVVIGSENVVDDPAGTTDFPTDFRFVGWNEEEYHLLGECNGAESLDITSEFIIDHNSIQDALNGTDTKDDENFLIWANSATSKAISTQLFGLSSFFYNITFTNQNKVLRHFGGIPNSIALFLGDPLGDTDFKAAITPAQSFTGINSGSAAFGSTVSFNDVTPPPSDVFDNLGDFNTGGSYYDVPADGVYNFRSFLDINYIVTSGITKSSQIIEFTHTIQRLDSAGVLIENLKQTVFSKSVSIPASGGGGSTDFTTTLDSGAVPLNLGDRIRVRFEGLVTFNRFNPTTSVTITTDSRYELLASEAALGVLETFEESDVKLLIVEFDHYMTRDQFLALSNDTNKRLSISGANSFYRGGWVSEINYELNTGETNFKILSNGN